MLTKIKQFVKTYQTDIILVIGVVLISLLSFAMGYIVAKQQEKEPIKIEKGVEEESFFSTFAFATRKLDSRRELRSLLYLRFLRKLGV
ncbi:MAG: hypothetical protein NT012_01740 [Candidatus Nealsonbacteria bacterium]|nr:hypothetical protein [Candidatus Nealsonbacteria bacterium]